MKKYFISSLLLIIALSANAQREKFSCSLRTYAGVNFSSVKKDPNSIVVTNPKTKLGLVIGADNLKVDKTIDPYIENMKADVLAGISYEYKNIRLDVSYTRVLSITSDDHLKNKAVSVTLGYRFELFKREMKDPSKNKYNIIMPTLGH